MYSNIVYKNKNNDLGSPITIIKLILFIIWPFGTFLYSFKSPSKYSSYLIFFLFTLLFSWSMYYDDYYRYIDFIAVSERFYQIGLMSPNEIWQSLINIFSEDAEYRDIYNLALVSLVRTFTPNFHVQYVVAAIPFSLFLLGSLRYLVDNEKFRVDFFGILLIFLFILPKDIFNIQNFRFSTATWMAVYGIFRYYISKSKAGALWIFLTPLVHSSFWFLVVVVLLYYISRHFQGIIKILFFVSIPFSFISSDLFMGADLSFLPDVLNQWAENYLDKEAYKSYGMDNVWSGTGMFFVRIFCHIIRTIIYILIPILIISQHKTSVAIKKNSDFLFFYIFLFFIVNMIQSIPVLGVRFYGVVRILSIVVYIKYLFPKYRIIMYILLFSCSYEILYEFIPHYQKVLDLDFIYSNTLTLISKHWGVTLFPHV